VQKKHLTLLIILLIGGLILSACSNGSSPTLRGKVYYDDTDSMVYNAEVLLDGQVRDKTDYYGEFYITGLENDSYTLRIRKKDAIEDYVETVYPNVNNNLIIKAVPVADTTIINGQVTISNRTEYESSAISSSSNLRSASNFKEFSKEKFVQNEIIVKYDNSTITSASNSVKEIQGLNIAKKINRGSGELVKFKIPAGKTVTEMIDYFSQKPGIKYAEPNYYVYSQSIPNDERYDEFDSNNNRSIIQWGSIAANLEAAWDEQKYSNSVTVAVLDSGIIPDHEDFSDDRLVSGANLVGDSGGNTDPRNYTANTDIRDRTTEADGGSHGTHVAGIIGALTNNTTGVAGVSWGINLMPVKVLDDTQSGTTFDVAEGIYYAVDNDADVLNMSLGADLDSNDLPAHLTEAVEFADSRDKILIGASGNNGTNSVLYPAAYPEVISVGSVDINNQQAGYSNYGPNLDLVAPGGDFDVDSGILSTWGYFKDGTFYTNEYTQMEGTSMSAAYVSGAAALLLESGVRSGYIRSRLTSTAVDLGPEGKDSKYGYGMLDIYGALLNKKIGAPYVFAATKSNGTLIIESNSTRMNSDGNYSLADRIIGDYYMVAWRDINDNFEIDGGDYFGISNSTEYYNPGAVYDNQDIDMYYVTSSSSAASLSVEGIEKLSN